MNNRNLLESISSTKTENVTTGEKIERTKIELNLLLTKIGPILFFEAPKEKVFEGLFNVCCIHPKRYPALKRFVVNKKGVVCKAESSSHSK